MSWEGDLLKGIAVHLHDQGVGTYLEDTPLDSIDFNPIVLGPVPDQPDTVLGLIPYSVGPDPTNVPEVVQMVQVWVRGDDDPDTVRTIGGDLFDALHGADGLTLGGIPCPFVERRSVVPMGRDGAGRYEVAHNYAFTASRPNAFTDD